ncbi:hypothetical protein [Gilvibacter sediminis]|uniref:hypothetical protein n=1 Tax=Gilvibacter sediminis TaxID=379071 RepID=UPI002350C201|nr:hypothetical protein [Gilvibacter sediminis]MDC7998621.1 hypothetical protein [Gilvibacter sediminis]
MKTKFHPLRLLSILAVGALTLTSCSSDDSEVTSEQEEVNAQISVETINQVDEIDLVDEELTNITLDIIASAEADANGFAAKVSDFLPPCVTVTTVVTDTSVERTVDFGDGCELPTGNTLSGSYTISHSIDADAPSRTFQVQTSDDFFFNDISVNGSKTIVRSINDAGNPNANKTVSLDVVWPDGETMSYSANKNREWIEGAGTGFWGDNVFLLSGTVNFTNRLGVSYSKETVEPLRREWACRFIVSGVLELSREDATVSLDFGDGTCDPFGTLTLPSGEEQVIRLRRFLAN